MEILSYLYEILFLLAGIYFLLFSLGKLRVKNKLKQEKVEEFRKSLHPWAMIFSILLILFYGTSLLIHILS